MLNNFQELIEFIAVQISPRQRIEPNESLLKCILCCIREIELRFKVVRGLHLRVGAKHRVIGAFQHAACCLRQEYVVSWVKDRLHLSCSSDLEVFKVEETQVSLTFLLHEQGHSYIHVSASQMSSLGSDIFLMNPKHNMRPLFHIDAVVMLADRVVKVFVCVENVKVNLFYK